MDTGLEFIAATPLETPEMQVEPTAVDGRAPMLSIILPTRNEAGNIHLLLSRIEGATRGIPTQVVFVDDSTDETPQVIREIAALFPLGTTVIERPLEQRHDGLGGAVVRGLRAAKAPWVIVMDADLQHPPELIPQMLEHAQKGNADMVLASRRTKSSKEKGLNVARQFISRTLDTMARMLFPTNLRHISDPLTGFFLARRDAIQVDELRPRGFKILLEILVRFPKLRVAEVPFEFAARHAGQSKASGVEVARYLSLLWSLRVGDNGTQFVKFATVGLSGIVVNSLALAVATDWLGIYYLLSAALATVASTVWNFALTEWWVFGKNQSGMFKRFSMFFVMNNIALALRGPVIYGMTTGLGVHYVISNLVSLGLLTVARFFLADAWIWGKSKKTPAPQSPHKSGSVARATVTATAPVAVEKAQISQ